MPEIPPISQLKATLLTSGLQQQNFPLYQTINQLIDWLAFFQKYVTSVIGSPGSGGGGGGGTVINNNIIQQILGPAFDGLDGIDGIDGLPGARGLTGPIGPSGSPGIDGECCENDDELYLMGIGAAVSALPSFTAGAVLFGSGSTPSITEDATELFWDNSNKRLGIGINTPLFTLHVVDTATPVSITRDLAGNGFNSNACIYDRNNTFGGGTPTNNDGLSFAFRIKQANGTFANVAGVWSRILDVTDSVATGALLFAAKDTGDPTSVFETPVAIASHMGFGYAATVGGAVTQITNKATSVTLNKVCGQITMNNAALAAGASVAFVFINNKISITDNIIVNICTTGSTDNAYRVEALDIAAGTCTIRLTNTSGASFSEAVIINFSIFKSVIT